MGHQHFRHVPAWARTRNLLVARRNPIHHINAVGIVIDMFFNWLIYLKAMVAFSQKPKINNNVTFVTLVLPRMSMYKDSCQIWTGHVQDWGSNCL